MTDPRDLITDAIVRKAAMAEWRIDNAAIGRWPGFNDELMYETKASEYEPPMRAALEAVVGDLLAAYRVAEWDLGPDGWAGSAGDGG